MAKETPKSQKQAALRWFSEQPRSIQVEAIKLQTALIRQTREVGGRPTPESVLDYLAEAAHRLRLEEDRLRIKSQITRPEARRIHQMKVARFKSGRVKGKPSPKREAIRLKFFHLIQSLRQEDGFGWRNCAAYLREEHKFIISHAYLREIVEELGGPEYADKT
jgi:hypothetical protein